SARGVRWPTRRPDNRWPRTSHAGSGESPVHPRRQAAWAADRSSHFADLRGRRGQWLARQREAEGGTAAGDALGPRLPIVQTHDRAADGEPQADAAAGAFDGRMMELGEQLLEVVIGQAAAVVL